MTCYRSRTPVCTYMSVCVCACLYSCLCFCAYLCVCACGSLCFCACVSVWICLCECVCGCVIHVYVYVYVLSSLGLGIQIIGFSKGSKFHAFFGLGFLICKTGDDSEHFSGLFMLKCFTIPWNYGMGDWRPRPQLHSLHFCQELAFPGMCSELYCLINY